jgi:Sec-independent protein secretion pathway component TatC
MAEPDDHDETDPPGHGAERRMTFMEHLIELRSRLLKCIYALFLTVTLTLVFYKPSSTS